MPVFLGDWIYEYGDDKYPAQGQGVSGRAPLQPSTELATLNDYRTRHRFFHTDANLVALLRRAPIIVVWDDHDVAADNAWENGTANPVQGVTYDNRKCNGVQAYHEYMPIRSPNMTPAAANRSGGAAAADTSNGSSSRLRTSAASSNSSNRSNDDCGGLVVIHRTYEHHNTGNA